MLSLAFSARLAPSPAWSWTAKLRRHLLMLHMPTKKLANLLCTRWMAPSTLAANWALNPTKHLNNVIHSQDRNVLQPLHQFSSTHLWSPRLLHDAPMKTWSNCAPLLRNIWSRPFKWKSRAPWSKHRRCSKSFWWNSEMEALNSTTSCQWWCSQAPRISSK